MAFELDREKLLEEIKDISTPIDFDDLEKKGIIKKHGTWYKVIDWEKLPAYAKKQIKALRTNNNNGCSVQFFKSWKTGQKLYRKLTGKEYNE